MEPKFQSSFIPKGPIAGSNAVAPMQARRRERSLFGFVAVVIFALSFILALATFGYGFYLKYAIKNYEAELESGRAKLESETVKELIRINDRINSTQDLIGSHLLLSPLFKFLEASTIKSVRFTSFNYGVTKGALELSMRGEARSYSALALQADLFNKGGILKNVVFSDLVLDEKGNVVFSFKAAVDPGALSYQKAVAGARIVTPVPVVNVVATSTATSTKATTSPKTTQ